MEQVQLKIAKLKEDEDTDIPNTPNPNQPIGSTLLADTLKQE